MSDVQINVVDDKDSKSFQISYSTNNKYTNRVNTRKFKYYYGTKTNVPSVNVLTTILKEILDGFDDRKLFGTRKDDPYALQPKEIRAMMTKKLKNLNRSHRGRLLMTDMEQNKYNATKPTKDFDIKKWKSESIFKPEDSAKTTCILGASFTGKTTLLVRELNKLHPNDYDRIVLFTESTNSSPLKNLNKKLQVQVFDRFCTAIPKLLKDINDETKNKFRFLLLLDDIIELKNKMFNKLILTMRNSNISTVVLIQYEKLITPSTRNSMHDYYITGLRNEGYEYMLRGFLGSFFREILNEKGSYGKLAERVREFMHGKVLHYDQRKNELEFYLRPN